MPPPNPEPNHYQALKEAEPEPQRQQDAPATKQEAELPQQASGWQERFEAAEAEKDKKIAEMRESGDRYSPLEVRHAEVQMDNELAIKLKRGDFDREPAATPNPENPKSERVEEAAESKDKAPEAQREGVGEKQQTDAGTAKAQRLAEAAQARQDQQAEQAKDKESMGIER